MRKSIFLGNKMSKHINPRYSEETNERLNRIAIRALERARILVRESRIITDSLEEEVSRSEIEINPEIIKEVRTYLLANERFDYFLYN